MRVAGKIEGKSAIGIVVMLSLIFSSCGSDGSSATDEVSASDEASSSSFLPLSSEYSISSSANIQSSSSAFQSCSSEFTANSSTSFYSSAVLPQSSSENIAATSSATTFLDPQPLWHDEFDGIALDTSKWSYEIGNGTEGWGNQEKEYYTSSQENAYISDGKLHIQATLNDGVYHSARLITKGKFSFTYGTIEARIALPVGKGIWPAFWMLGANIDEVGWPRCGEIDIIEAVNSEHIVYGTNHWANGGEYAQYGNNTHNFREQEYPLDITQFHDYKMTWDSQFIRMSIDGFTYHEISIQNNVGDTEEFHKPFFILLNVAVGGNWPGFEIDDTQFPNEMVIDYIRVYPIQNP